MASREGADAIPELALETAKRLEAFRHKSGGDASVERA
jgi:hypothetical protein